MKNKKVTVLLKKKKGKGKKDKEKRWKVQSGAFESEE